MLYCKGTGILGRLQATDSLCSAAPACRLRIRPTSKGSQQNDDGIKTAPSGLTRWNSGPENLGDEPAGAFSPETVHRDWIIRFIEVPGHGGIEVRCIGSGGKVNIIGGGGKHTSADVDNAVGLAARSPEHYGWSTTSTVIKWGQRGQHPGGRPGTACGHWPTPNDVLCGWNDDLTAWDQLRGTPGGASVGPARRRRAGGGGIRGDAMPRSIVN